MTLNTGTEKLDQILNGGFPERRTTLISGTPGTGKSTLAMQFLQQGLQEGDRCLFISTEQTVSELQDSFSPFDFTLDHEDLSITSLQIRGGRGNEGIEGGNLYRSSGGSNVGSGYVLRTLEGGTLLDDHNIDLSEQNLRGYLRKEFEEVDRVVVDSVSGLRPIADDERVYRRVLLDLIHLFNAEWESTVLFTAESMGADKNQSAVESLVSDDAVQFNVHGVIRLWREEMRGQYRRFLDVMKMRGVDHETRRFELTFTNDGLRIVPEMRSRTSELVETETLPTKIEGLDEMLGGGLMQGRSALLEHDGQADIDSFLYAIVSNALDQRMAQVIVPRVDTSPDYLRALFEELGASMETLLSNDQLFIIDASGAWEADENVIDSRESDLKEELLDIRERAPGHGILFTTNTEALVHSLGPADSRELRYWIQSRFISDEDIVLDIHNPALMDDDLSAFYLDAAQQVIETWLTDHGLQYIQYRKGRNGDIGAVQILEYIDEPPFVRGVE